jgi:hypothetical protein
LLAFVVLVLGALVLAAHAAITSSSWQWFSAGPNLLFWIWGAIYLTVRASLYIVATVITILWIAARFDRLAGRMGSVNITRKALDSLKSLNEPMPETPVPQEAISGSPGLEPAVMEDAALEDIHSNPPDAQRAPADRAVSDHAVPES